MIQGNSFANIIFNITYNSLGIFAAIMESSFIPKFPNSIEDRFNQKPSQARDSSLHARPLEKENKETIEKERHTEKRRQNRRNVRPNSFSANTIKKTMVNCFLSRARRAAIRVNTRPILHGVANLNRAQNNQPKQIIFKILTKKPSRTRDQCQSKSKPIVRKETQQR